MEKLHDTLINTNKYQTPITEELLASLPTEVKEQLLDFVNNVEFIKRLVSPNREYAKDRPRDSKGRIIVDLANPHILEDMDYFRPTALHFKKYGCFTKLRPNPNPNSEYGKWLREEIRRCWEGYTRPTDGEWVTGFMYFYMNYCPIMLSVTDGDSPVAHRKEDFPETWEGIYWRFHYIDQARNGGLYNSFKGGQHGAELAKRGCSKSFCLASIMAHNFILGENKLSNRRVMTILTAYQKEYLAGKDGTLSKFIPMIDFLSSTTQFPRLRLKNSQQEMIWQMGYQDLNVGANKGTLNTVIAVSVKDDQSKLRGKRGYILFEEFGSFPKVLETYNIVRYGVEEGNFTFGLIYLVGTSGDKNNDFEGAQELLYYPKGYNIYTLPNVYDKVNQGKPSFAFFFPAYINRKGCYNKDGVSDIIKALIEILTIRHQTKYNSSVSHTLVQTIADMPITPAEAIIKTTYNMFPVTDLTERLAQLEADQSILDQVYIADLVVNKEGKIEYKPSFGTPIRDFPTKNNKIEGAIELYQMPEIDKKTGRPFNGRYIAGADPYDNDEADTMSFGSIFVLDLWTDRIVAEYTGRPLFADDYFEICRKLCVFYNARLNYEQNKKGLFSYFSRNNCLYLLTDVLDFLKEKEMARPGFGNTAKGTTATAPVNAYAKNLLRKWLLEPVTVTQKIDGEEKEVEVPRLYTLKNKALIKELIGFNSEGNFDRISAMGMLMLLREDKMILYKGGDMRSRSENRSASYLGNDKFFTKNYDSLKLSKFSRNETSKLLFH